MANSETQSEPQAKRTCEVCGGGLRSDNRSVFCRRTPECRKAGNHSYHLTYYATNREKIKHKRRAYYEANRENVIDKVRAYAEANRERIATWQRAYREANREKTKACVRAYREANIEKIKAKYRAYYAANREKIATWQRAYREANREKINAQKYVYYEANREKIKAKDRASYEANREDINQRHRDRNAIAGKIPRSRRRGHLSPTWRGGELMYCSVPGCHRIAGWKCPSEIRRHTTGFRCSEHRNVRLPEIKEERYEYQSPEEIRSSVA